MLDGLESPSLMSGAAILQAEGPLKQSKMAVQAEQQLGLRQAASAAVGCERPRWR